MSKPIAKKHYVDIMFLMILFLMFTFSAVSVLIVAINSYKGVVNASEMDNSKRIATSYIREVVHQNDRGGNIKVSALEGHPCIAIDEGEGFFIYIYEYDGSLLELNAKEGSGAGLDYGDVIMDVNDFSIESKAEGKIIEISITDTFGVTEMVDVGVKSGKEESYEN